MENITFLVCVPDDLYWATEIEVQLNNMRKWDYSKYFHVLVFNNSGDKWKWYWNKLQERYSETKFFFYNDKNIQNLLAIYQPIIRPNMLKKHFERFPELSDKVIFYLDSDVIFSKELDIEKFFDDDICYLSSTPYIGAKYFYSKDKDVYPFRLGQFKQRDVLQECCHIVGIDKQVAIDNEDHTGGCQYLLKDIDSQFWEDVEKHCIELRLHCLNVNAEFFPSEDKGYQSWAIGDMCSVLWNLWKRGKITRCPEELDFSWAPNKMIEFDKKAIYHNAGVTGKEMEIEGKKEIMFNKSDIRFRTSSMTFFDIEQWGNISSEYCSYQYVQEILSVEDPICRTRRLIY